MDWFSKSMKAIADQAVEEKAMVSAYKPRGIFGQALQKAKAAAAPQQGMFATAIKNATGGTPAPKEGNFFSRAKARAQGK